MHDVATRAAHALDTDPVAWRSLPGGQMEDVLAVELRDGRTVVGKGGPAPRTEARMLRALAEAGAPAPAVLAVDADVLVLELLPSGDPLDGAWEHLGTALARLHASTGGRYGWTEPYAFGRLPIPNEPHDDWPTFWAERRLIVHAGRLPTALARRVETLAARLGDVLPATPPASLLHGDLWRGNVVVADGRVTGLLDPAAYHGHAEVDLAMLTLFDRPSPAFWRAYGALEAGARDRRAIYALWPAIVHVAVFGAGYHALVERLLREAGA